MGLLAACPRPQFDLSQARGVEADDLSAFRAEVGAIFKSVRSSQVSG